MMQSLRRKTLLRADAEKLAEQNRQRAAAARTGQVARSSVDVYGETVQFGSVLEGVADTADMTLAQDGTLSHLDGVQAYGLDQLLDGDGSSIEDVVDADDVGMARVEEDAARWDEFDIAAEETHAAHMDAIAAGEATVALGRVPAQVSGLTVVSNVGGWSAAGPVALVSLVWSPVAVDVDGEQIDGIAYEVFSDGVSALAVDGTSETVQVPSGVARELRVRAVSGLGVPGDLSPAVMVTGAAPSVAVREPSAPVLHSGGGSVFARWDGGYVSGGTAGAHTVRVEARIGDTAWRVQGSMPAAGEQYVRLGALGDAVEVRFVALDQLARVTGTSATVTVTVVGVGGSDLELTDAFYAKVFTNALMAGRIQADHVEPAFGDNLNLSANGTILLIAGRQDEQDTAIAGAQQSADSAADSADMARSEADAARAAARIADGKALVAQTLAENNSDRLTNQQSVFRVTSTGADVASIDGSNLVQVTPTGVAIVQGGAAASTWDAARLIVNEAVVSRAQIGNHVAERVGNRTIWRPV